MEFYLSLACHISTTGHRAQKFILRRLFHDQLKQLRDFHQEHNLDGSQTFNRDNVKQVGPFSFLPLITCGCGKVVELDVILLSHFEPQNRVAYQTGDVDNKLKAIMDGLRMAQNKNEIRSEEVHEGEELFYTLLEDDALVSQVNIRHDRLLFNLEEEENKKDTFTLIKVRIRNKF